MLRRLYDWTVSLAAGRHALWALAAVSFAESSFPLPPDILLIPLILARPNRAWRIAGVCTVASVLGGAFGYFIGWGLLKQVGRPILNLYGMKSKFDAFASTYNAWGAWAVLIAGVTPFPYKVITILSGATGLNFAIFMTASALARGLRFFVIAALLWQFGLPIRQFIEERLALVFSVSIVLLVGGNRGNRSDAMNPLQRRAVGAAAGSAVLLLGALGFQYLGGLAPCHLCLLQRWPHAVAIVLGIALLAAPWRWLAALGMAMLMGAGVGIYHVGIETGWWPGPTTCSAPDVANIPADELLNRILETPVVLCDQVAWSFLGISMAGWNAILSLGLAWLWWRAYASSSMSQ